MNDVYQFDEDLESAELREFLTAWQLANQGWLDQFGVKLVCDTNTCKDIVGVVAKGMEALRTSLELDQELDFHKKAAVWGIVIRKFSKYLFQPCSSSQPTDSHIRIARSRLAVNIFTRSLIELDRKYLYDIDSPRRKDLQYIFSANQPTPLGLSMIGFYLEREFPVSCSTSQALPAI